MPKITEIFAFICEEHGPEDEGVVGMMIDGVMMPLVGADPARVASLKPLAARIARTTGKRIRLIRFTVREDGEWVE